MKKIITLLLTFSSLVSFSQSLVISQVYGAGGNSGSVYKNDFIELFNPTGASINIADWSIQYNSATSTTTTWQKTKLPNVSILPGQYFLVQQAQGTGGTTALPTPDFIGVIPMRGTAGKVVLVSDTNAIALACPTTHVVDKVGYGLTATCFEGAGTAPVFGSNANSIFRGNGGCTDANNNATDFTAAAAAPRNTASPLHSCGAVSPSLAATPVSLPDYGSLTVGLNSVSASFNVSGSDLTGAPGNITITAPASDFQVSNDNSTWGATTTIAYTSATLTSTLVYVRFTPQSAGPKTGNVTISGGGVTTAITVAVSGTGLAAIVPTLSASTPAVFGNVCVNAAGGPNSFVVSGTNLTTADVTIGPLEGFTFSTTTGGTYSATLALTQGGGSYSQTIFVTFKPTAIQLYNGNIPVSGGGAAAGINVTATGSGVNSAPAISTGAALNVTAFAATLTGLITNTGCTAVTAYGIEYSTVNGFPNGTGTNLPASNLSGGSFSSSVAGLTPSTTYFYKAFATNAGGTTYGIQLSFQTPVCAAPSDTTGAATAITTNSATVAGTITDTGCTAVSAYGIQYSAVRTFANGFTTKLYGTAPFTNNFSVGITNLVQGTKYFYRAFATNRGGTAFGELDSFITVHIPYVLTVYSNPVTRGGILHYSRDYLPNGYYGAQLFSSTGQLVYQKNMSIQVGFVDDTFIVPGKLQKGVYILKLTNNSGYSTQKSILVL